MGRLFGQRRSPVLASGRGLAARFAYDFLRGSLLAPGHVAIALEDHGGQVPQKHRLVNAAWVNSQRP